MEMWTERPILIITAYSRRLLLCFSVISTTNAHFRLYLYVLFSHERHQAQLLHFDGCQWPHECKRKSAHFL